MTQTFPRSGTEVAAGREGEARPAAAPSTCEYAPCSERRVWVSDGWAFCARHYREHRHLFHDDPWPHTPQIRIGDPGPLTLARIEQVKQQPDLTVREIAAMFGLTSTSHALRIRRAAGIEAPRSPAECGTRPGYKKHAREGTPSCEPCREAERDYQRVKQQRRRAS